MGRLLLLLINTRWSVLSEKVKLFMLEREKLLPVLGGGCHQSTDKTIFAATPH